MRDIGSRTLYCERLARTVTVVHFRRNTTGHQIINGVLSCSHQEQCAETQQDGARVFPWRTCPACAETARDK